MRRSWSLLSLAVLGASFVARASGEPKFMLPMEGPLPEEPEFMLPIEGALPEEPSPRQTPAPEPVHLRAPAPAAPAAPVPATPIPANALLAASPVPAGYVRLDSLPPSVRARYLSDGSFAGVLIQPKSSAFAGEQPNNFGVYFQGRRGEAGRILHGDINKQLPWCKLAFAVKKDARGQKIFDAKQDPVYLRYAPSEVAQKTGAYQHVSKSIRRLRWGDTTSVEIMMDTQRNAQTAEFLQCFVGQGKNWQSTYQEPTAQQVADTMSSVATFYVKLR